MMSENEVGVAHLSIPLKMLLLILTIVATVVPCVLGFVNFDKRIDIVEVGHEKRVVSNEKQFDKLIADVDSNEDAIHALELVDRGLTIQYQEILKNQEKMVRAIDNLVRAE